jgi:hypothetical protein
MRLLRRTIWAAGTFPPEMRRHQGIYQWVLPLHNLAFIITGLIGLFVPLPSVARLELGEWVPFVFAAIMFASSLTALLGLMFRWSRLEVAGKVGFILILWAYVGAVWVRTFHDPAIAAASSTVLAFTLMPIWRLYDLAFERWVEAKNGDL